MSIRTTHALIIGIVLLAGGYVWATFYPDAPYSIFAPALVGLFGGYTYKRLQQKKEVYQHGED